MLERAMRAWIGALVLVTGVFVTAAAPGAATDKKDDEKIAQAGVFAATDFPAGWKASSRRDMSLDLKGECSGLRRARDAVRKQGARASSRRYEKGMETYQSDVAVLRSEQLALTVYEGYSSSQAQRCQSRAVSEGVKSEAEKNNAGDVKVKTEVSEVTGSGVYGDESAGYEYHITVQVPISGSDRTFDQDFYANVAYARTGRAMGRYTYFTETEPSASSGNEGFNFNGLILNAVSRLTAALGGQPKPNPNAPAAPSPLGTTLTAGNGAAVTVFVYEPNVPGRFGITPDRVGEAPSGSMWALADVQVCAPPNGTTTADSSSFKLVFSDNTDSPGTSVTPRDPELRYTKLAPSECARGNVGLVVIAGKTPAMIVFNPAFDPSEGKPLRWAVG